MQSPFLLTFGKSPVLSVARPEQMNQINPYRKRLIKKGIISGNERGFVDFMIPLFREYVLMQVED